MRNPTNSISTWRVNEAVAEQVNAENTASQLHKKNFHTLNKGEWTKKEKLKLVQINKEERQKGKMFMIIQNQN